MTEYDFLPNIPIDEGHTLDQLTGRFQTVKDGLPELPKNSKDQYFRLGVTDKNLRQIVIIANSNLRSLAVLDFAGAEAEDFNGWKRWSSRTANRADRSNDIEGGHGNGGKAFMVRGSTTESYMESVYNGLRTKMGFKNDEPGRQYYPAVARENGRPVLGQRESNPLLRLRACLANMNIEYEELPAAIRAAFESRNSYTFIHIGGVKDFASRRPATVRAILRNLHEDLIEHAQVALTLETCQVWVMVDGASMTPVPLVPRYPEPFAGFEELSRIDLPEQLIDPETREMVHTGTGERGYLQLRTSRESLRRSDRRKAMNVIRVRNTRNIVDNWSVADLAPRPESTFIFGTLSVPAFAAEHQVGSERRDMADVPLVRATKAWVSDRVDELAAKIQQSQARNHRPEDRNRANDALDRLRNLMRRFLHPEITSTERKFGEEVSEVILEGNLSSVAMAVGTRIPLQINCYELLPSGERLPVLRPTLEMVADDPNLVSYADGVLKALASGRTRIRLRVPNSPIESNAIDVELVACTGVDIILPERTLLQGEQVKITSIFRTDKGERDDLLIEGRTRQDLIIDGMVDEPDMGKLSRNGRFTAGSIEGEATIRIRFGPSQQDTNTAKLVIGPESMPPKPPRNNSDIPLILMCGATVPGMQEFPVDQRTHSGGEYHPTIIMMEPPFENVVWINPNSKESTRVRQERGTAVGIDRIASRNFLQFIALKCFEVLKHLKVRQEANESPMTDVTYRLNLAQAEMDCADFIDAAFDLADELYRDSETH